MKRWVYIICPHQLTVPTNSTSHCNGGTETEILDCCSASNPCGLGQGGCDNGAQCAGELVCGIDNCGSEFLWGEADCCKTKEGNILRNKIMYAFVPSYGD